MVELGLGGSVFNVVYVLVVGEYAGPRHGYGQYVAVCWPVDGPALAFIVFLGSR